MKSTKHKDVAKMRQVLKKRQHTLKLWAQKLTAYSFLGATAVNFINTQSLGTSLGLIAGLAFFADVIIFKK